MSMNVVDDESNCCLLFEFLKKVDELVAGEVMIEKSSYHNIILLFLKFFTENIEGLKLNMRIRQQISFCKGNNIWIRIDPDKV